METTSEDVDENNIYLFLEYIQDHTSRFFKTRRNASIIVSRVAFLPTSRKLALFPYKRSIVSFVAIANPAPLTIINLVEYSTTYCADISPRDSMLLTYRTVIPAIHQRTLLGLQFIGMFLPYNMLKNILLSIYSRFIQLRRTFRKRHTAIGM